VLSSHCANVGGRGWGLRGDEGVGGDEGDEEDEEDEGDEEDEEEVTKMALDGRFVKIISSAVPIANAKEVIKRCQNTVFVMITGKIQ